VSGRGRYLGDVTADLVLISLANAVLPLFVEGVEGIVQTKARRYASGRVPVGRVTSWGLGAPKVAFPLESAFLCK
jgi:hypothetical protein